MGQQLLCLRLRNWRTYENNTQHIFGPRKNNCVEGAFDGVNRAPYTNSPKRREQATILQYEPAHTGWSVGISPDTQLVRPGAQLRQHESLPEGFPNRDHRGSWRVFPQRLPWLPRRARRGVTTVRPGGGLMVSPRVCRVLPFRVLPRRPDKQKSCAPL